jgi:hypothetical protein
MGVLLHGNPHEYTTTGIRGCRQRAWQRRGTHSSIGESMEK